MRLGIRGHDVAAETPEALCEGLIAMGVRELQLVAHKSFPAFSYSEENISALGQALRRYGIETAVYGCYIDPLTEEGQLRFHQHIRYARLLNAGCIATETAPGVTTAQEDETRFRALIPVFRDFAEDAAAQGVRCAVETVWAHPLCSPEKTARLFADVGSDNLYAILDPVNLVKDSADPRRAERTRRAVMLYGSRVLAVHWKDSRLDAEDPALRLARESGNITVITEGLTGNTLKNVIQQLKQFGEDH